MRPTIQTSNNCVHQQTGSLHKTYIEIPVSNLLSAGKRILVFSTRGISYRHRHLMNDLRLLLPHSKKDSKLDTKSELSLVNEVCETKNCNQTFLFECRKNGKDLYMQLSSDIFNGPSAKFLVQNGKLKLFSHNIAYIILQFIQWQN